jgi:hypothetical protein
MIYIEKAIETNHQKRRFKSPLEWFINQEHIPFNSSDDYKLYLPLYHQFLQELHQLYLETNSEYFWFTHKGKLMGDAVFNAQSPGIYLISSNNIRINKQKLRDIKLEEILKNN